MTKTETTTILDIWTSGDELQVINNLLKRYVDEGLTTANGFDLFYLMSRILAEDDLRDIYYQEARRIAYKENRCPICWEKSEFVEVFDEENDCYYSYIICKNCESRVN